MNDTTEVFFSRMDVAKRLVSVVWLVGALLCTITAAQASTGAEHVRATLMADVDGVGNKPFRVGVLLEIDPGWHIYWKNPGDSGSPTRVMIQVPAGFKTGPVQFPVPQRMEMPGEVVNFGYENRVMLIVPIEPAPRLDQEKQEPVSLSADVRYLVCSSELCLPGSAKLAITLPSADVNAQPRDDPATTDLFRHGASLMPVTSAPNDVSGLTCDVQLGESGNKARATIRLQWSNALPHEITFFPGPVEGFDLTDVQVKTTGLTTTCSYLLASPQNALLPPILETVVAYTPENRPRVGLLVPVPSINRQDTPPAVPPASP